MNQCADNVKAYKLKKEYLTNLNSDIESDKVQLAKIIEAITLNTFEEKKKATEEGIASCAIMLNEIDGALNLMVFCKSKIR